VNHYLLAVWLWLFAWLAVDVAGVLVFNGIRGRGTRLSAVTAAFILFGAAILVNAGVDLW
jgi:hypothetical protein